MKKEHALLYGNGPTLKKNICWIRQLYEVSGITDTNMLQSQPELGLFTVEDALLLDYDVILVTSYYYSEIREYLIQACKVREDLIRFCLDEFHVERHLSFGDSNPETVFYILRAHWDEHKNGLFNFFSAAVTAYYHTRKKNQELLIDMKNYYTEYAGLERYGKVNVWEDYFSQPSGYSLEEVYQSRNVILSKFNDELYVDADISEYPHLSNKWYTDTYEKLSRMIGNRFKFNSHMLAHLRQEERLFRNRAGGVLGVLARGTDMIYLKPENHFIPYDTDCFIAYVKQWMKRESYDFLYLATEDLDILERFQFHFSDSLLYSEQQRTRQTGDKMLMEIQFDRENDGFLRGKEYATIIHMLSLCDALVANCICGGVLGALVLNGGKYKQIEVLDAGIYKQSGREA